MPPTNNKNKTPAKKIQKKAAPARQPTLEDVTLKPEWMRPPPWRWSAMQSYLADPLKPYDKLRTDKYLTEAVSFYNDRKKYIGKDNAKLKKAHPECNLAFELHSQSRPGGWRWYLEALLLTGMPETEIRKILKVDCPVDAIKLFRSIFFDVSAYQESEVAVYANVLSTSRAAINDFNNHDYTWKMFAYCWGAEEFIKHFCSRDKEIDKEHLKWFRQMSSGNLTRGSYHATNDMRIMYNAQALEVLRTAQTYWNLPENALGGGETMIQREIVSNIIGHVDMHLMAAEQRPGAVEKRYSELYQDFSFN